MLAGSVIRLHRASGTWGAACPATFHCHSLQCWWQSIPGSDYADDLTLFTKEAETEASLSVHDPPKPGSESVLSSCLLVPLPPSHMPPVVSACLLAHCTHSSFHVRTLAVSRSDSAHLPVPSPPGDTFFREGWAILRLFPHLPFCLPLKNWYSVPFHLLNHGGSQ